MTKGKRNGKFPKWMSWIDESFCKAVMEAERHVHGDRELELDWCEETKPDDGKKTGYYAYEYDERYGAAYPLNGYEDKPLISLWHMNNLLPEEGEFHEKNCLKWLKVYVMGR